MSIIRVHETQSRGLGCPFSVIGLEIPGLGWEGSYRPEPRFNTYNYLPSQSPATHPSHRHLLITVQNTAQNLFSLGK